MEGMGKPMKRAVVVGSGPFRDAAALAAYLREDDLLVAADGGTRLLEAMGKTPSMLIGDFDSSEQPLSGTIPCKVLPVRKDDTDVLAAVRLLLKDGYQDFLFLGVLGGRLDHTIANLFVLRFLQEHGATGCLVDETHEVRLLSAGVHELAPREDRVLSLLPYGGTAHGVTVTDAAYTLDHTDLDTSFPIGVSNAFIGKTVTVSISEGCLLCIFAKDS